MTHDLLALGYEIVRDVPGARPFWRIIHTGPPRPTIKPRPKHEIRTVGSGRRTIKAEKGSPDTS
jgi:hypothetical protein